jgi:mono/diheme cytochrome c family protein
VKRILPHLALLLALASLVCAFLSFERREVLAQAAPADAATAGKHAGLDPFKQNCASCHTIGGGKLVGPDLKGLKDRAPSRDWVLAFLKDPKSANDDYGKKVRAEFNDTMTAQAHLGDAALNDIIDFIFAGGPGLVTKALRAATQADVEIGRQLFLGERRLQNGGPSCISCHGIQGVGGLGGGSLAAQVGAMNPDLTNAFNRNGGEKGLQASLQSPQFLVMKQVFAEKPITEDEVVALTAYLGAASRSAAPDTSRDYFIVYGIVGAIVLLVALDLIWIKRFRNVRRTLVGGRP